jgi:hypothetical protein
MRCLFVVAGAAVRGKDEVFIMLPIFIETLAGDKRWTKIPAKSWGGPFERIRRIDLVEDRT